jgi:predicted PurR-regulated permease PerM
MTRRLWRGHRDNGGGVTEAPGGDRDGGRDGAAARDAGQDAAEPRDGQPAGAPGDGVRADGNGRGGPGAAGRGQVPGWLQLIGGWAWRLLVVGVVIYLTFRLASALRLVVLPFIAALLLTALLQPLTRRLRRSGLPSLAATWCTVLVAVAVLAAAIALAATLTSADYQTLVRELGDTTHDLQRWLAGSPFHFRQASLAQLSNRVLTFLKHHQSAVAGTVLSGGRIFIEILAGLVLTVFVTFFLLKDGDRIWAWLTGFLSAEARRRARGAGTAAWQALTWYVRGTIAVAAIHAVVIGFTLWVLGVPLLAPLVILVFLAAFVPIIGILVAGALAVAVTLGTRGWVAALVLVAVFILENQLESHLLQPLVVGRMVRLHPLAIILVLAVGAAIAGIAGAVVAVPITAALVRAGPYLRGDPGPPVGRADQPGEVAGRR